MRDSDNGFSFGAPADGQDSDPDDSGGIDAIEIDAEPVSRSEARNMGHAAASAVVTRRAGPPRKAAREEKSASGLMRLGELPKDLSGELADKLEAAWEHLNNNETSEALTLAQEVVWEHPALVAPKLIIARCFINRKEYDKALKLLQAIGDSDMSAETLYYIGLCQSRLGSIGEAMESLKLARASAQDAETRKRAGDLMQHLHGEQIVCPVCGRKSLYDSMVDVGNQTVCAHCARKMKEKEEEEDDDWEEEAAPRKGARKKRLKPPLTKADILLRLGAVCSLLALGWIVMYILSLASPAMYASARGFLPDWTMLPPAQRNFDPADAVTPASQIIQSVTIDSPPLRRAIAGVELRHQVYIEGPRNNDWRYDLTIYPEPSGAYSMDGTTGEFRWTPAEADAGRIFELTFSASYQNHRARDQINQVEVSPGPRFANIANWTAPRPGEALLMAAADLDADGRQDLILSSGAFWEGGVAVFDMKGGAADRQLLAETRLSGRPSGLGVVLAGGEPWIAVADYWNSRLRYYALRAGSLSEMSVDIDLPGRPILTAFDTPSSTIAALCRGEDANHLLVYRQTSQLDSAEIGDWVLPDDFIWRRVLILDRPASDREADDGKPASRFLVFGGDAADAVYLMDEGDAAPTQLKPGMSGTLLDAATDGRGGVFCLVQNAGGLFVHRFTLNGKRDPVASAPVSAGKETALGGFAVLPSGGEDASVPFVLSTTSVGLSVASTEAESAEMNFWALPRPARLMGDAMIISGDADSAARVAHFDDAGGVWAIDISAPRQGEAAAPAGGEGE